MARAASSGEAERRRHVHGEHRADIAIVGQDVERRGIARAIGVAHDVDRIAARPDARHLLVELGDGLGLQRRQLAALVDQQVGGDDAGAAAIGQDRQPLVARQHGVAQRLGGIEQLAQSADLHQTRAGEGRLIDGRRARHRSGVRRRRLRRRGMASGLEHDHRLQPRHAARGRHELAGLGDALDIHQHGAGLEVARQHVRAGRRNRHRPCRPSRRDGRSRCPARRPSRRARPAPRPTGRSPRSGRVSGCPDRSSHSAPAWARRSRCSSARPAAAGTAAPRAAGDDASARWFPPRPCPRRAPSEMTTATLVPRWPRSTISAGTDSAGVMITARSGTDGSSDSVRSTGRPAIEPPLRLTRWISPLKPPASRFCVTAAPTEPGRSLAPIATTDLGAIRLVEIADGHGARRAPVRSSAQGPKR